ncbi:MAG: hypothetical protein IJB26_05530, partial [Clostridia bacterium]|nr:hypothetical protein [Clostridia bacterium]
MGERTFGSLFGPYLPSDDTYAVLAAGEIENLEIHHASHRLTVQISFADFVSAEALFAAEKSLAKAFGLQNAAIHPRFPQNALTAQVMPSLVMYLKRENVAVNGTFDDAEFSLDGDVLSVRFVHGGVNILRTTKADEQLKALVYAQYGRRVTLRFEGEDVPQ